MVPRSLWVIMSLLKEEVISGGIFLVLRGGGWREDRGEERCLLTCFSGFIFLCFLSTVERWQEVAWLWLSDAQWGHSRGGVLKSSIKVEITCEKNVSG